jgi:hypothetical protein
MNKITIVSSENKATVVKRNRRVRLRWHLMALPAIACLGQVPALPGPKFGVVSGQVIVKLSASRQLMQWFAPITLQRGG